LSRTRSIDLEDGDVDLESLGIPDENCPLVVGVVKIGEAAAPEARGQAPVEIGDLDVSKFDLTTISPNAYSELAGR
jgi:hypothetical protein